MLQVQMSPDREYSSKLRETMQACHIIYAYLSQFFVTVEHDFIQETDIQNVSHMEIYSLSCSSLIMDACISKVSKM